MNINNRFSIHKGIPFSNAFSPSTTSESLEIPDSHLQILIPRRILSFRINYYLRCSKKNIMGKGDIKTKRGKIINGSFGVSRPHKEKKVVAEVAVTKPKKAAKKA